MGQKVNPVGYRLGFNKNWYAHWFGGKKYAVYLQEDERIKKIIMKKYSKSGISSIEIFRSRGEITVSIHTAKPGVIIGRSGVGTQELKATLERQLFSNLSSKARSNLRLNIIEVKNPEMSAQIVADTVAGQIERRISVKRAMKQAVERSMEKKVNGIKIRISGRLGGAEIARSESVASGSIPLQTIRSNVDYALSEAHTTYGVVGVKVWIYLGEQDSLPLETTTARNSKLA
ncbi:30S ribosomal protein S3 [Patescibacteria group bacterium]|nr:30S ribosomal protein S3 [Patescibacteria group bacterium]